MRFSGLRGLSGRSGFSPGLALKLFWLYRIVKIVKNAQSLLLPSAVRLGGAPYDLAACRTWGFLLNAKLAKTLAVDKFWASFVILVKTALLCTS